MQRRWGIRSLKKHSPYCHSIHLSHPQWLIIPHSINIHSISLATKSEWLSTTQNTLQNYANKENASINSFYSPIPTEKGHSGTKRTHSTGSLFSFFFFGMAFHGLGRQLSIIVTLHRRKTKELFDLMYNSPNSNHDETTFDCSLDDVLRNVVV